MPETSRSNAREKYQARDATESQTKEVVQLYILQHGYHYLMYKAVDLTRQYVQEACPSHPFPLSVESSS